MRLEVNQMAEKIDKESIVGVSRMLFGFTLVVGAMVSYAVFTSIPPMGSLFEGMALAMPWSAKLFLSPMVRLTPVVLIGLAVGKEYALRDRPLTALKWNAGLLVALNLLWAFHTSSLGALFILLIGNPD